MEWAERGVEAFPERTDSRLREFLAAEYHRLRRHPEAMTLVWDGFVEFPTLENYRNLKKHADLSRDWKTWRTRALSLLREAFARTKRERRNGTVVRFGRSDHTELVRVFLREGDVEAAWREASEGGCSVELWMELAARREREHPEDALPIYRRQVEPALDRKNNQGYGEAVELLKKLRELMTRLGENVEFARYMDSIRAAHKRKRNFIKLLDREKWS